MEVPDAMISDAIKKKAGYTYYMAKKVESEKAKIVDEPVEQRVSPVKSGRGKGFMCYGDQVANFPNKLKKDVVPRKTRSLTIAEEAVVGELEKSMSIQEPRSQRRQRSQLTIDSQTDEAVADMYNEWGQKLKGPAVEDPAQPVAGEGSCAAHNKYYSSSDTNSDATLYSSSSEKPGESAKETDDANESDMDLLDDNPHEDDVARYGVFMHNKSTATPISTYLSLMVTSSSLHFIQTLLDETPANELMDFMSHLVYTDAHATLVVDNLKGNPKLTRYISYAFEIPLGTHVDVLTTKTLMQEMFPDEYAYHIPSLPANKIPYPTTYPKPSSLQAKAKKLMQKAKNNMRNFNFKKAVAQKFREYDKKLEALTNFNISKAFEKSVQAKVLAEIKKLLHAHIPDAIENYVKSFLNTYVLKVMKTNQINLFTQSSTSTVDLSEMDLKLKLLNQIHLNKSNDTHTTHQQLYDTLYESIILDQDTLDAQAAQSSFYKRSHDNQDPPNNHEGENKKKRRKDVGEPSSVSLRQNRSPVVIVQDDTPAMQPLDQANILIKKHSKPEWFPKKLGLAKRRMTWFDLFLKSDIDNDENHILKPSTISIAKKFKKYTTSITKHYDARYYKEGIEDRFLKKWSKEVRRYHFEALNVKRSDDKEYEFSYADLPRLSVDDVEDMYLLQVQDKLYHLPLEFVKDFNNALLMFIRRIMIKNKLSEVKKFGDGTLVKIQENLIDMLTKNKLGSDNKRLKGRYWTDYDVKSSREMLKKIDEILRHIEQLRRLEEYVGGRPKTINPCTFFPAVKGWLDEDLDNYHLKELRCSTQCHTQMSMWIISRGVVLLILLMEYKVLRDFLLHRSSINNSARLSNKFGGFYFSFKFDISGLLHHVSQQTSQNTRFVIMSKLLEYMDVHDNDASESSQPSWGEHVYIQDLLDFDVTVQLPGEVV
ncbi:hypothetical protein Tco_1214383 [Tanacetum coccineum]